MLKQPSISNLDLLLIKKHFEFCWYIIFWLFQFLRQICWSLKMTKIFDMLIREKGRTDFELCERKTAVFSIWRKLQRKDLPKKGKFIWNSSTINNMNFFKCKIRICLKCLFHSEKKVVYWIWRAKCRGKYQVIWTSKLFDHKLHR